ncbi:hypothetical protein [Alloalcanivorax gelatiniphagus]|nr:hypothetical protein [Alloalcanivorax gelatiniphagus]
MTFAMQAIPHPESDEGCLIIFPPKTTLNFTTTDNPEATAK